MKLIAIPPYQNPVVNWGFILRELVGDYDKRGNWRVSRLMLMRVIS